MSWLYGEPVKGDISEFRQVRMDFCYGASNEYIMHKDHVARFVEASVRLHHTPGINPANRVPTSPIWRITSATLHGSSYWWSTPSLEGNDDPAGAAIVKGGPSETVFIDRERVDQFNREEDEMEAAEEAAALSVSSPVRPDTRPDRNTSSSAPGAAAPVQRLPE